MGAVERALPYRYLFGRLVREEWRLHAETFGGRRFAVFPAFVALVAGGTATFLALGGADAGLLLAGLHLVVALLGLQVGTVGLVGRDAVEDLLGDTTLLIYSARTLPVPAERLVVAFVLKDVLFYAFLFVLPLVGGVLPLVYVGAVALVRLPLLFLTSAGMFALGVGASLALVGVYTRSRPATLVLVGGVAVGLVLHSGLLLSVTPYRVWVEPTAVAVVGSLVLPVALVAIGTALFRFEGRRVSRNAPDRFRPLHRRLGRLDEYGALSKSLLDVSRSAGGLAKLAFSQGLVFGVLAVLLAYLPDVVPVRPAPGLTVATILALGTFTTYSWLFQFEDERFYRRYPVPLEAVFRAKLAGFCLLALPVGLAYLALGGWLFGLRSLLVGVAVFVPLSLYVFGVTGYVAGFGPTELLFDTPTFALFTAATMAVLVPLVIVAIAMPLAPGRLSAVAVAVASVAGVVGYLLYRRAGPRWADAARDGAD
ncbi:MAG: hypothetical protein V5A29_14280 [Haloarculaceae archaeon]